MFASIFYVDQIQPAGGRSRSSGRALARVEDAAQIFQAHRSLPDQQECTDQVPHHVMKKSIAADGIDQFFAFARPTGSEDCPDVGWANICWANASLVNILARGHPFHSLRI